MGDDDDLYAHTEILNKRRADREATEKKASQSADFGPGQRGELLTTKRKDDDLEVIDKARIEDGEMSR